MNKSAIQKTAILQKEGDDYVVRSVLCADVIGAGDTESEAWQVFSEILEEYLEDRRQGKIAKGPGRPKKGKTRLHAEIDPDVKKALTEEAESIGISQGEMVEYLYAEHLSKKQA